MPTPNEEMTAFLSGGGADDSRRLDVATVFTRSMLRELRAAVAEWEATSATIEEAHALRQRRRAPARHAGGCSVVDATRPIQRQRGGSEDSVSAEGVPQ